MRGIGVFVTEEELVRAQSALKDYWGGENTRDVLNALIYKYDVPKECFLNTMTGEFCFVD